MGKESASVGQGKASKAGWIKKDKDIWIATVRIWGLANYLHRLTARQTDSIIDTSRDQLQTIQSSHTHPDPKVITDLRKRKLITVQKVFSFEVDKGPKFAAKLIKEETDLTADMLAR